MDYFLDCEFNGYQGELISLGLVREDGEGLYLLYPKLHKYTEWVAKHVMPILLTVPDDLSVQLARRSSAPFVYGKYPSSAHYLEQFFAGDKNPHVITDWPDDIKYFCEELIVSPGKMIDIPRISFEVIRVDAWPTIIPHAVQHNAYWDACALRDKVQALRRNSDESNGSRSG